MSTFPGLWENPVLRVSLIVVIISALTVISVSAQRGMEQGKGIYDPSTEITVKGTVEEVKEQSYTPCGWSQMGTHLSIKSDGGTFDVRLGPKSFLTKNNFSFAKGDKIEIIGSKAKINTADVVIAREVKKGDKTLTLRNAQGVPAWSGGRRY